MKLKLKALADVQMGYSFRSGLDICDTGAISVIQMKDLDNNMVNCHDLVKIDMEVKKHHLVKKHDLIFRSRGQVSTSTLLVEDLDKAIVAAPLLRIRVAEDKILPEYLNWYINQREAQSFLASRAEGTVQKMISKQVIENIDIVLPSLETQNNIVTLSLLSIQEQALLSRLAQKREQYISTVLMRLIKDRKENIWK